MRLLYICTHNRCRSILSEAITNKLSGGKILAASAGSQPSGEVHPLSIRYLQQLGYPTDELKSQSWNDFSSYDPDIIITVCDSANKETCPLILADAPKLHWGLADPSKVEGSEQEIESAFITTIKAIEARVTAMLEILENTQGKEDAVSKIFDFANNAV